MMYEYYRYLTVDNTKVVTTNNITDFPFLFSTTSDFLKTRSNGGRIRNSNGYDIIFTSETGVSQLDHEIIYYNPTTGQLIAWVRIPILKYDEDTDIRIYYGNSAISSTQENVDGTWASHYQGVWHLKEATDATNVDSSGNGNNGTPSNSPASIAGKIYKGLDFSTNNQALVDVGSSINFSTFSEFSVSGWVKPFTNYDDNDYPTIYVYGDWRAQFGLAVQEGPSDGLIEHYRNNNDVIWSNTQMNINSFNHFAVIKRSTDTLFYLNGANVGTGDVVSINQDNENYIGGYPGYNNGGLNGIIEEMRVSNTIIPRPWYMTEYNNQNSPSTFYSIGREIYLNNSINFGCEF